MNERIRELAIKARQEFLTLPTGYTAEQVGMYPQLMEKFAELIVRECCEVINKDCNLQFSEGIITNLGGLNQARELIKQHFGVE